SRLRSRPGVPAAKPIVVASPPDSMKPRRNQHKPPPGSSKGSLLLTEVRVSHLPMTMQGPTEDAGSGHWLSHSPRSDVPSCAPRMGAGWLVGPDATFYP